MDVSYIGVASNKTKYVVNNQNGIRMCIHGVQRRGLPLVFCLFLGVLQVNVLIVRATILLFLVIRVLLKIEA